MADRIKLGATHQYSGGKPLRPGDRGGLYAKFGVVTSHPPLVAMDFGTTVNWVSMPPEDAIAKAEIFRKTIIEAFGNLAYNASTLPLSIMANRDTRQVETTFPDSVGVLVANPEVFLAWAEKLEEAAKTLLGSN